MTDHFSIETSLTEFVFLARLLGGSTLVGTPDPFGGWLAVEIEEAWEKARADLSQRGLLLVQPDGSVRVAPGIASLVGACTFAQASVIVTHTLAAGAASIHAFHAYDGKLVQQITRLTENPVCLVSALPVATLAASVEGALKLEGTPAGTVGGRVRAELLGAVQKHLAEGQAEQAAAALTAGCLPPGATQALIATLLQPVSNSSLVIFGGTSKGATSDGCGFLVGTNGIWLLKSVSSDDERWVDLTPVSVETATEEVHRLLSGFMPAEVVGA